MPKRVRRPLSQARVHALRQSLDALIAETGAERSLAQDPLSLPADYRNEADVEVAAVLAAGLAFGRVASFLPFTRRLLNLAQSHGGPAAWARDLGPEQIEEILPLQYRWTRGSDLALLVATLGAALRSHGRIGAVFETHADPDADHIGGVLEAGTQTLHELAKQEALRLGLGEHAPSQRGFSSLLSRPSGGSACKRMCMLLRWMTRSTGTGASGVDLGLWALSPSQLVIPLDTHVLHTAQLIGLTQRTDGSWKTALEITASLRQICPEDPTQYDFALAHLGISGDCKRRFIPAVCAQCALLPECRHGGPRRIQELGSAVRFRES